MFFKKILKNFLYPKKQQKRQGFSFVRQDIFFRSTKLDKSSVFSTKSLPKIGGCALEKASKE